MDISKADPQVIYGIHGELQKSTDGGRTWSRAGPAPDGVIGLAAASLDADRLYASTRTGLMVSIDGGRRRRPTHDSQQLASMVSVTPEATVYTFIVGAGPLRAAQPKGRGHWWEGGGQTGR